MLDQKGAYTGFDSTINSHLQPHRPADAYGWDFARCGCGHDHSHTLITKMMPPKKTTPKNHADFWQNHSDATLIKSQGFVSIKVYGDTQFDGISIHKTGEQYSTDAHYATPKLAQLVSEASGIVALSF